jgi:hypothetical protein
MQAFLWVVWLVTLDGHVAGSTRMLAVFPPVDGEAHAAATACAEVALRLTRSEDGRRAYFCREVAP